jgi:hypothetical protein
MYQTPINNSEGSELTELIRQAVDGEYFKEETDDESDD